MSKPVAARLWLNEEQRECVRDCLRKANLPLPSAIFVSFLQDIQDSISRFVSLRPSTTFRETHNALRSVWLLAHEDDPPVGLLRARLKALPKRAIEYIERRFCRAVTQLFPGGDSADAGFLAWSKDADGIELVRALRVVTAEGGKPVAGRSRGSGKRSGLKLEPMIFGEVRGAGANKGGRPSEDARQELVMNLGLDWLYRTGQIPESGRSGNTAFGELVHSVFQWLGISEDPHGAATYALRRYWEQVELGRKQR
jgi:hypothetical protein